MPNANQQNKHHKRCREIGHFLLWTPEEEALVEEVINKKARRSTFAKYFYFHSKQCYSRRALRTAYIGTGCIGLCLLMFTVYFGIGSFYQAVCLSKFQAANCSVDTITWNKNLTATCVGRMGTLRYRCLQIFVLYRLVRQTGRNRTRALFVDQYANMKSQQGATRCSTTPQSCTNDGSIDQHAKNVQFVYKSTVGNDIFRCIYNPRNHKEVTLLTGYSIMRALHIFLLLIFLVVMTAIQLACMCATYGCQYIFTWKAPEAIKQQVKKQKQAYNEQLLFHVSDVDICQSAPEIRTPELHSVLLHTPSVGPAQPLFSPALPQTNSGPPPLSPCQWRPMTRSALSLPPAGSPTRNLVGPSSAPEGREMVFPMMVSETDQPLQTSIQNEAIEPAVETRGM